MSTTIDMKLIEKSNKAFHRMSKKNQRIAIAKDVLLQMKMKTYVASPGEYIWSSYFSADDSPTELQKCLLTKFPACHVCGIGAAFLSLARLGNEVCLKDEFYVKLDPIFGIPQRTLIERTFEGWYDCAEECQKAPHMKFNRKYPDDDKRLAAIFRNIIRNDGVFKP